MGGHPNDIGVFWAEGRKVGRLSVTRVCRGEKGAGMLRILSCLIVLLVLILSDGLSLADTFKCTRPDGSVFFTNDPSQAPRDCVIEEVKELPPVGVIPDSPIKQPPKPTAKKPVAPQTVTGEMKSFESFKSEAALLVEQFQSARHRAVKSSFVTDKLQARREMTDIKVQNKDLLSEINQSSLSNAEKSELTSLLSPINE
jgi:hypothetical protein